jgi:hypothetical protein
MSVELSALVFQQDKAITNPPLEFSGIVFTEHKEQEPYNVRYLAITFEKNSSKRKRKLIGRWS